MSRFVRFIFLTILVAAFISPTIGASMAQGASDSSSGKNGVG